MAQPAVIFVVRHGPRLDGADPSWILSTPTPYDPPLTYGGWNQSRTLGSRIASLLHEREQTLLEDERDELDERPRKRRRVKHKVVIHTSPFLRCLQTSIAIAAGMAQYKPPVDTADHQRPSSASPRLRAADSASLPFIPEPRFDFAHAIARKTIQDQRRHHKPQLRVDAFLGEWLNVQYFEGITAPPPSAMMLATAKAELWEEESVEFFRPTLVTKTANNSLWAGTARSGSRESPLDDWSPVEESLSVASSPARSRANSQTSYIGNEHGRKSPYRPGSPLQPRTSTLSKAKDSVYKPPVPQYAVGTTHQIPRGYVAHAREATADVDYSWDSSRAPQDWGDGGVLGEEWSELHRRFRKGLSCLVDWYSQFRSDDNSADEKAPGTGESYEAEDVHEDLVVVLVTHGAGCNALIGALTGQPVLLDMGMASLSMAVRRDDAPTLAASRFSRRGSIDTGLSSIYEVKMVASTDHLRPGGADLRRTKSPFGRARKVEKNYRDSLPRFQDPMLTGRRNTNSSLGSIRRPSAATAGLGRADSSESKSSLASGTGGAKVSPGLWTPPTSSTPMMRPQAQYIRLTEPAWSETPADGSKMDNDMDVDHIESIDALESGAQSPQDTAMEEEATTTGPEDDTAELAAASSDDNSRRMSGAGLWSSNPSGASAPRRYREPKRRWTEEQNSQQVGIGGRKH